MDIFYLPTIFYSFTKEKFRLKCHKHRLQSDYVALSDESKDMKKRNKSSIVGLTSTSTRFKVGLCIQTNILLVYFKSVFYTCHITSDGIVEIIHLQHFSQGIIHSQWYPQTGQSTLFISTKSRYWTIDIKHVIHDDGTVDNGIGKSTLVLLYSGYPYYFLFFSSLKCHLQIMYIHRQMTLFDIIML